MIDINKEREAFEAWHVQFCSRYPELASRHGFGDDRKAAAAWMARAALADDDVRRDAEAHPVAATWQPIESAPRDGRTILLRGHRHRISDGYWLKEAYDGNGAWVWAYVRSEPTHWMPHPSAPKSPAESEEVLRG